MILTRRGRFRHLAPPVIDLIAAGKVNQLLRKERLLAIWNDERIDDNVVDEIGSHGGGITEIAHLHRRRTVRRDRRPGVMSVALEIDQDVDLVGMDPRCGLVVRQRVNIDKPVECRTSRARIGLASSGP